MSEAEAWELSTVLETLVGSGQALGRAQPSRVVGGKACLGRALRG